MARRFFEIATKLGVQQFILSEYLGFEVLSCHAAKNEIFVQYCLRCASSFFGGHSDPGWRPIVAFTLVVHNISGFASNNQLKMARGKFHIAMKSIISYQQNHRYDDNGNNKRRLTKSCPWVTDRRHGNSVFAVPVWTMGIVSLTRTCSISI